MNAQEIKQLVDEGKTVCWSNQGYVVTKDSLGQYFIKFIPNGHVIGLTWLDGVTLNGAPEDFFVVE